MVAAGNHEVLDIPKEMRHEVIFRELGKDKTEVRVIEYGWPVCPMMEMSRAGLEECLDEMAALFVNTPWR